MTLFVYNCLVGLLSIVAVPYLALRARAKGTPWGRIPEKFGFLPLSLVQTGSGAIWLHAVSVGEALAAGELLRALRTRFPQAPILVSTATPTGQTVAAERLADFADGFFYAPLDFKGAVRRTLRAIRPGLLIVMETEIWPNLFSETARHGAGVMIVNARISDRSAPSYRRWKGLFGPVLEFADRILAQSELDRERFIAAGADARRVKTAGNLKYDFEPGLTALPDAVRRFVDSADAEAVIVAGSTREGEEELVARAFAELAAQRPRSLLIVAPRHPQRFDEAAETLRRCGLKVVRRSELGAETSFEPPGALLLDTLGELSSLYSIADVVFVGGSLNGWGGHNVLEPALAGRPVVVGPDMQNFREIADRLVAAGGLVQIAHAGELASTLSGLLADRDRAQGIGERGRAVAQQARGAVGRIVEAAAELHCEAAPVSPPNAWLAPLAGLWSLGARLHRGLYQAGLLPRKRLPRPAICVGNLSAGGSGKTPAVLRLVEGLRLRGYQPAVLTRGYGRRSGGAVAVVAGDNRAAAEIGDEAALLRRRFAGLGLAVAIGVGADRTQTAELLLARGEADVFVLDDGFQHHRLERDLDLVLIDVTRPPFTDALLPAGRLRENARALARAHAVLLTRTSPGCCYARLQERIRKVKPELKIWRSRMRAAGALDVRGGADTTIAGRRVFAFCGIGAPQSFWRLVESQGGEVVGRRQFRDHQRYSREDWRETAARARQAGADVIVTTEKDFANLSVDCSDEIRASTPPLCVLRIEIEIDEEQALLDWIEQSIGRPA